MKNRNKLEPNETNYLLGDTFYLIFSLKGWPSEALYIYIYIYEADGCLQ